MSIEAFSPEPCVAANAGHGRQPGVDRPVPPGGARPATCGDRARAGCLGRPLTVDSAGARLGGASPRGEIIDVSAHDQPFEKAVDAVVSGDVRALRNLLTDDPTLAHARSARAHRATLLHYSAANGVEDDRQKTPDEAVAVAELLVSAGADINATASFYGGGPGSTPLVGLVTSDHPERAGLMADLVRAFAKSGQSLDGIDDDGLPIVYAFLFRKLSAAHALAECGARVDNAAVAAGIGRSDLVERLVGRGRPPEADPGALRSVDAEADGTAAVEYALLFASIAGETDVARLLVERGVDVNARRGLQKQTALHEAAAAGHLELARLLVDAGARVDLRDGCHHATPVGWAAHFGRTSLVDHFLEHCMLDLLDLVALRRTDLVQQRPKDGTEGRDLPLWLAAASGDLEMVRLLLDRGADRAVTDPDGKTALDWAVERGHDEIVALLRGSE